MPVASRFRDLNTSAFFEEENPQFAVEAGMAALRWLVEGYGYEITALDVLNAYSHNQQHRTLDALT